MKRIFTLLCAFLLLVGATCEVNAQQHSTNKQQREFSTLPTSNTWTGDTQDHSAYKQVPMPAAVRPFLQRAATVAPPTTGVDAVASVACTPNTQTKGPNVGTDWQSFGNTRGTEVYANSFVAGTSQAPTELGLWMTRRNSGAVGNFRIEVWGDAAPGPDPFTVLATTGSISLSPIGNTETFISAPVLAGAATLTAGETYWFIITTVGEAPFTASYSAARHTQNSVFNDNGTFWFSNDVNGINFAGQNRVPEMAHQVVLGCAGPTCTPYMTAGGNIPSGAPGITSGTDDYVIPVDFGGTLGTDVEIDQLVMSSVTHTFANDLDISLISPAGTSVSLMFDDGGINGLAGTSCDLIFEEGGSDPDDWEGTGSPISPCNGDTFDPALENDGFGTDYDGGGVGFDAFDGEATCGDWILRVTDDAGSDIGSFAGAMLTFCGTPGDCDVCD
ncbi:MAG: hypothetical protein AAF840_10905, partial [Bacteroidota bacterium]